MAQLLRGLLLHGRDAVLEGDRVDVARQLQHPMVVADDGQALAALRRGAFHGAAVLVPDRVGARDPSA